MQVTDTRVLATLTAERIDPDYVEFHDYDRTRPYSKLYVDRLSNRRVLVSSGLPRVRVTDGSKLVPGWELSDKRYWLRNNLFEGYATPDGQYHIAVVNDQPDCPVAGDEAHWSPVLTIGKEIVTPRSLTILETDPTNPDYHDNVLEWDYGVCKRRIRVIEGRFRGSWIFDRDPGADVRIEYNREGRLHMRLGLARDRDGNTVEVEVPVKDVEYIPRDRFLGATAPVTVGDSATFYPDANPESATVDGDVARAAVDETWTAIRAGVGTTSIDSSAYRQVAAVARSSTTNQFSVLQRGIFLFNTSSLGEDAEITAATLSLYSVQAYDEQGSPNSFSVNIVSTSPASNTGLTAADYGTFGSTVFSIGVGFTSWATLQYINYALNSAGIAAINRTGISKYGTRDETYDINGTTPPWSANTYTIISARNAEYGTNIPKLTVTYTVGGTTMPVLMNSYRRMRG
jgi:hypothetical protein